MYLKSFTAGILPALLLFFLPDVNAQSEPGSDSPSAFRSESKYSYQDAFGGNFYSSGSTVYRSASGNPGPGYWQNRADYRIEVALDEQKNRISGAEVITYTNNSPDELNFLWLQLDQNLFRDDSRGSAIIPLAGSRSGTKGQSFEAGYRIKSVKLLGTGGAEKELNCLISDTRMQVSLPSALNGKGGKVQIRIEYSFVMPDYGSDRTGILDTKNGKIFAVAQWYPRMCVYDDISGWNTIPYYGPSEFYLEYGDFDVSITAPSSHIVVCSGQLQNPEEVYTPEQLRLWKQAQQSDATTVIRSAAQVKDPRSRPSGKPELTWHFRIENSRDVAWASSASFILDAARINLPEGKTALAVSAYPPESDSRSSWSRSTEYTKASIEYNSAKWYPYPYPVAVNVASNISGMEYPGIVFCSSKEKNASLWGVTDHEFGHTWFPMIVGSNERLHPWMDEGFNTFINYLSTAWFNKGEYADGKKDMHKWASILEDARLEPVMTSADNMKEHNIANLVYYKPALGLYMLRNSILGEERFDSAFRTYIRRWAWKHSSPDDFFRTMENVTGEDLRWFWRGWFLNNWKMDQAITGVNYYKNNPKKGVLITVANLEKMPMPVIAEIKTKQGTTSRIKLPVEIWERNSSWTFLYPSTQEISSVTLDPDHVFPDCNSDNDTWKVKN